MPTCSSGWIWHSMARETGNLGHLYSPGDQRGPWPWLPYALDNGAYSCWDKSSNTFNYDKWEQKEPLWRHLIFWAQSVAIKPLWAVVPDVPGHAKETLARWPKYAPELKEARIPLALAVQDGMTPGDVGALAIQPDVIFVGGGDEWKWKTVEVWCAAFPRVHLGRCNMPEKLNYLESLGCESTDGTGWNRGSRTQTAGLEEWARQNPTPTIEPIWPHVSRVQPKNQQTFA